jgi:hypothetical protein
MEKIGGMNEIVRREVLFVDGEGGAWPWTRQLRDPGGVWGATHYTFALDSKSTPDWLVVFSAWPEFPLQTSVPRHRRIFVAGEPESFHRYQPRFLEQFGTVVTSQRRTSHPGAIYMQPGINWFAGVRFQNGPQRLVPTLAFADFVSGNPKKTKLCSVVCSTKAMTRGHRQRIEFVERLRQEFEGQIDFFGRGRREVADKDEALAEYRFHIALENSVQKDYWTEKLADPFLRGCYPIYSGCPNLSAYFPKGSYAQIDISKPKLAIAVVREILASNFDQLYATELAEAKRRVLLEHNIFAVLEKLFFNLEDGEVSPAISMEPSTIRLNSDHEIKNLKWSRRFRRWTQSLC